MLQALNRELNEADKLLRFIAGLIAKNKPGVGLRLIGGLRYRVLNGSQRLSTDIDYHCEGPLPEKQAEVAAFCRRVVLREVKRFFGYEGTASIRTGPDADSANAKFVDLRFWKPGFAVDVPVEITDFPNLDPPTVRTVDGTIYSTASDADVIEGKILAVFNRPFLQHRDLMDVFLFQNQLLQDSDARLRQKFASLQVRPESIRRKLKDLQDHTDYHARAIQKVIDEQMETVAVDQVNAAGGGKLVLKSALEVIQKLCGDL